MKYLKSRIEVYLQGKAIPEIESMTKDTLLSPIGRNHFTEWFKPQSTLPKCGQRIGEKWVCLKLLITISNSQLKGCSNG